MFIQFGTANHQDGINERWQLLNKEYYHILILDKSKICILYTYLVLIIRNDSTKVGLPWLCLAGPSISAICGSHISKESKLNPKILTEL